MKKTVLVLIALVLTLTLPCLAGTKPLNIQSAQLDLIGGYLYVYGNGFSGGSLNVSLGRFVLSVSSNTGTAIQAVLPADIPDG